MVYFFSIFSGISFVVSCAVDSLNLFSMLGFLLAGLMGRGGVNFSFIVVLVVVHSVVTRTS